MEEGGWCSCEVKEGHGVGLWKTIHNLWPLVYARSSLLWEMDENSSFGGLLGAETCL